MNVTGRTVTVVIGHILIAVGVLVLGFVGYLAAVSGIAHDRSQRLMYGALQYDLGQALAPVGPVESGRPVGIVQIDSIGVNEVVVEGTRGADMTVGPGHRRDTPLPGQPGTSVIYGRSALFGGPFGRLRDLHPGDKIIVYTGQGVSTYDVTAVRPANEPYQVPRGANRVVLLTVDDKIFPRNGVAVDATLSGYPYPPGPVRPQIDSNERNLAIDRSATSLAGLWGILLLLSTLAMQWARRNWHLWAAYICGAPIVIALLWMFYESASRLLPNTW